MIVLGREQVLVDEELLNSLPTSPAVFLISVAEGRPYLARTANLRRRALRLLKARETPSRMLNLRDTFLTLEYALTGSSLDSAMRLYELARLHFPAEYATIVRLRMPPYLKLLLSNEWPRTSITTHLGGGSALAYGPFRSRTAAEQFESQFLDLFQIRRCQETLVPTPDHPGCIYGEMNKCLRPCQSAATPAEYASEVARAKDFLATDGHTLLTGIGAARAQLSAEMQFEEAARQHRRFEQVQDVLRLRDDLAIDIERMNAIAIARSASPNTADLFFIRHGQWQGTAHLSFDLEDGKPVSIDRKIREQLVLVPARALPLRERQERLALLARWFYSTWRDGELLLFPSFEQAPIRKLVNAVSRVMLPAQ